MSREDQTHESVLREYQSYEGWTDATALRLALDFIGEAHDLREWKRFLATRAHVDGVYDEEDEDYT